MARASRDPADEALLVAVRLAMAISVRASDRLGDVSPVQLRALNAVRENSGGNLNGLAQEMGVTVSTASRLVDRLVASGYADRRQSEQTRREISLVLTPSGGGLLRRYDRLRLTQARACLDRLPEQERAAVVRSLQLLTRADDTAPAVD